MLILWLSGSIPRYLSKGNKNICLLSTKQDLYKNVHGSFIHSYARLQITQVSTDKDGNQTVHSLDGLLLSNRKGRTSDTCNNGSGPTDAGKRSQAVWLCLEKVLEHSTNLSFCQSEKCFPGVRCVRCGEYVSDWQGHGGIFWGDGSVLCTDDGGDHTGMFICQNTLHFWLQMWLWPIYVICS